MSGAADRTRKRRRLSQPKHKQANVVMSCGFDDSFHLISFDNLGAQDLIAFHGLDDSIPVQVFIESASLLLQHTGQSWLNISGKAHVIRQGFDHRHSDQFALKLDGQADGSIQGFP